MVFCEEDNLGNGVCDRNLREGRWIQNSYQHYIYKQLGRPMHRIIIEKVIVMMFATAVWSKAQRHEFNYISMHAVYEQAAWSMITSYCTFEGRARNVKGEAPDESFLPSRSGRDLQWPNALPQSLPWRRSVQPFFRPSQATGPPNSF